MILKVVSVVWGWAWSGLSAIASAAWTVATTYPRTTLAVLACVAAWFAHGWDVDRKLAAQKVQIEAAHQAEKVAAKVSFDAAVDKLRGEVADWVIAKDKLNQDWQTAYDHAQRGVQARVEIRIKEVPTYVTPLADSRCVVPVGFLQHAQRAVDAANGGSRAAGQVPAEVIPREAVGLVDAASGVSLSAVDAWIQRFAGVAEQWRERALSCDRWIDQQAALFNQEKGGDP